MKTKHTPGPWFVYSNPSRHDLKIIGETIDIEVCQMNVKNDFANAKLIAAAPDLLKAARDLCGYFACMMEDINVKEYVNAVNAIKKATE